MSIVKYAHKNAFFLLFFWTTPLTTIRIALNFVKFWTIDQNIFCGIIVIYCVRVKGWLNISNKCLLILAAGAAHARSVAGGRGQAASHPRSLGAAAAEDGEWWWCDPQPRPGHLNPTPDSAVSQRIRRILITMHPEIPTLYLLVLFYLHHHFFKILQ